MTTVHITDEHATGAVWRPTHAGATRAAKGTPSWLRGACPSAAPPSLSPPRPRRDRDRGAYVGRLKLAIDKAMEKAGQTDRCDPYRGAQVGEFVLRATDMRRALLVRERGGSANPNAQVLGALPPASIELEPDVSLMLRRMVICADARDRWSGIVTIADDRLTIEVHNRRDDIEASEWVPLTAHGVRFRFGVNLQEFEEDLGLWPLRLHVGNPASGHTFVVLRDAADTVRLVQTVRPIRCD